MAGHRAVPEGVGVKEHLHHTDHLLYLTHWFLNLPFWYFRFIAYFALLGFIICRLRKLSIDQDTDPNPDTARLLRSRRAACWGIPCFAVVLPFLSVDLVKTLDYKWFSTMWGVYVFAGSALNSMAVIILVTIALRRMGYLRNVVGPEHDHLMGKLAFAFTVFWAYISFDQYFLIWYANLPEATGFFKDRGGPGWLTASLMLVICHFAIPFFLIFLIMAIPKNFLDDDMWCAFGNLDCNLRTLPIF